MVRHTVYVFLTSIFACAGCVPATIPPKAHPDAMTLQIIRPVHKSASSVVVTVRGGDTGAPTTSLIVLPQITNEDFTQALRQSIEHSGLFAHAKKDGHASYELEAFISHLEQPMLGSSMTVSMEANYTLTRMQPKQIVWQKVVTSTYSASFNAAFDGATRALLATEGAARRNIEQAIQEMSKLRLE